MSLPKLLGHASAVAAGALSINPSAGLYTGIHTAIATALPTLNPGDTSEVLRLLAGLVIGVLSKFLYGWIDKKFKSNSKDDDADATA